MTYRFDMEEWLARFPLDVDAKRYSGKIVTSPCHACNNEHLRREMQDEYQWGPAVPVDIFVMAAGEPEDRCVTKIGGLPYRPANALWPKSAVGEPLLFLGQFNFEDSLDITGPLPGEVLLLFADYSSGILDGIYFEWQPRQLSELMAEDSVPGRPYAFTPCFGHVCRTLSFPSAERIVPRSEQTYPKCRGKDVWTDYFLLQWQATQIGSAPFFIQRGDDELPGRPLCTISSVQPERHDPYPWVNRPEPLLPEGQWRLEEKCLMLGDMGCIYVSIDEDEQLHWGCSCY